MAARELFVWYRVRREHADEARATVAALQRSLQRDWPDLQARLLVRDGGETSTWMETYALPGSSAGADRAFEAAVEAEAAAWASLRAGPRHVEAFSLAAPRG